jgi:hypothetical protein
MTISLFKEYSLPEKKEYAKIAITLTGSKGQALRVFEKKSPHLRFAPGSIFYSKNLDSRRFIAAEKHILFFFFFVLFSSLFPKK